MLSFSALVLTTGLLAAIFLALTFSLHLAFDQTVFKILRDFGLDELKLLLVVFAVSKLTYVASKLQLETDFTPVLYSLEASTVTFFQSFLNPVTTYFFLFVYLVGFPVLLITAYFKIRHSSPGSQRKYAVSYMVLTLLAVPFFYLTPVKVSGFYLESLRPLLYSHNTYLHELFITFGNQEKAFPSLHTGLSFLATLYSLRYTEEFGRYAGLLTLLIILSTFYLGVHWILDAVAGIILASISFFAVEKFSETKYRN